MYVYTASRGCDAASQYDCGDGVCVHKSLVCNGRVNCNKSRDEANCTHNDAGSRQYDRPDLAVFSGVVSMQKIRTVRSVPRLPKVIFQKIMKIRVTGED